MKKLKYIALPLFASVLLASCGSSEEQTSAGTSSGAPAETTEAPLITIAMTEEAQEAKSEKPAEVTNTESAGQTAAAGTENNGEQGTAPKNTEISEKTQTEQAAQAAQTEKTTGNTAKKTHSFICASFF